MPLDRGASGSRHQVTQAAAITAAGVGRPEDNLTLALMTMLA
jgi:hypothetical protein